MTNGDGLVLEYFFDEGNGDRIGDFSPNKFDAQLEKTSDYERPERTTGYASAGGGLLFRGNALLNVGSHSALNRSSITIMAWVFYDWVGHPDDSEERQEVLEKVGSYWLNIRKEGRKARVGFRTDEGDRHLLDSVEAIPPNTWTHLAATYQEPTMKIYINGTKDIEQTFSGSPSGSEHPLTIGGRFSPFPGPGRTTGQVGPDAFFNGTIDTVRIYSRALDENEINDLISANVPPLPRPPSGLRIA